MKQLLYLSLIFALLSTSAVFCETYDENEEIRILGIPYVAPSNRDPGQPVYSQEIDQYDIKPEGTVIAHNYFQRDLDAPAFENFHSTERNRITDKEKLNKGTCYGISMFTMRYYQWFILPWLLDDVTLENVRGKRFIFFGGPKVKRGIPEYGKIMAKAMNLPDWMLEWPEGNQSSRTAKIAPYRLRTYLANEKQMAEHLLKVIEGDETDPTLSEEVAMEQSVRMFDNQFGVLKILGTVDDTVDEFFHNILNSDNFFVKLIFGKSGFETLKSYINNPRKGVMEIGFCGSVLGETTDIKDILGDDAKIKERVQNAVAAGKKLLEHYWGHSVVAFKITEHDAKNSQGEEFKAYKVHIYDSNDPFNTNDTCFWHFPDKERWVPGENYRDMYSFKDSPLMPADSQYMKPFQLHPSTENMLTKGEENLKNVIDTFFEDVSVVEDSQDGNF